MKYHIMFMVQKVRILYSSLNTRLREEANAIWNSKFSIHYVSIHASVRRRTAENRNQEKKFIKLYKFAIYKIKIFDSFKNVIFY